MRSYARWCWFSLMQTSNGRSWAASVLILSLKRFDCDISSGVTWRTRLKPQTESVKLASMSSLKFLFSGLHAAMTAIRLLWLLLTSSEKKAASCEI